MAKKKKLSIYERLAWWWFWIGLSIGLCYLGFVIWVHLDIDSSFSISNAGAFGDLIGGVVGSLWALTGVFLFFQALKDQQKEFTETRDTLKSQTNTLWLQQFENTFFNMLKVQNQIREFIEFPPNNSFETVTFSQEPWKGLNFFNNVKEDLVRVYAWAKNDEKKAGFRFSNVPPKEKPLDRIQYLYPIFFKNYQKALAHYFRHLYHILKFISISEKNAPIESKVDFENYGGILQSQLSVAELVLLFYNGLCFRKMYKFINKYKLLQNLPLDHLADPERHKDLYPNIRFLTLNELFEDKKVSEDDIDRLKG